ncbi:MAG: CPBP family intramembrane metalloprotease [Methanobacteriota archaeon]|nr:MAG: CPBP family intramembrane metalloprotease [Euryarchaeota archaeon]
MLWVIFSLVLLIAERLAALFLELGLWQWIGVQTLLFTGVPLFFMALFHVERRDVGLSLEGFRHGLRYAAAMLIFALPFMVYGAMQPSFKLYYPLWAPAREGVWSFILFELAILVMMFNTEFFFRGLLLFNLERSVRNRWAAIVLHAIPYALVHIGKPGLEVPYSFFAGVAFGWLALKTRSVATSTVLHWTSSVIFDLMVIVL